MNKTYRALKAFLDDLSEEQLDQHVSIWLSGEDEMLPVRGLHAVEEDSDLLLVLDEGHPYLEVEF